jgi:hypothetical protein
MSKHRKRTAKEEQTKAASAGQATPAQPPVRRPILLAVCILLFVIWFVFLLVTALTSNG